MLFNRVFRGYALNLADELLLSGVKKKFLLQYHIWVKHLELRRFCPLSRLRKRVNLSPIKLRQWSFFIRRLRSRLVYIQPLVRTLFYPLPLNLTVFLPLFFVKFIQMQIRTLVLFNLMFSLNNPVSCIRRSFEEDLLLLVGTSLFLKNEFT